MSRIKVHKLSRFQKQALPGTYKAGFKSGSEVFAMIKEDQRVWIWIGNDWFIAPKKDAENIRRRQNALERGDPHALQRA